MLRRRRDLDQTSDNELDQLRTFHEWVLSLPWVVERPYEPGAPRVRCFAVDCAPLGRRQVWLVTGLRADSDSARRVAVVLPEDAAVDAQALGWGRIVALIADYHALVVLDSHAIDRYHKVEALVLTAYGHAMSSES
jgi:hypothetical protein